MTKRILKHSRYICEFIGASIIIGLLYILPFTWASAFGGFMARTIGPRLKVSNNARRNVQRVFSDISTMDRAKIIVGMWNNLGRTIAEYPHLRTMNVWSVDSHVEIINGDIIDYLRDDGRPALLFLGHMANWEYATLCALQKGLPIAQLYRTLNNPYIAWLIGKVHGSITQELVTKGSEGAKQSLAALKRNGHLSMLVDQKLNEGIAVPFLGIDAMTAPALAKLALKFNCPLIPVRVERLTGVHCRVTYYPPIELPSVGTVNDKVYQLMLTVNTMLSQWIKDRPQDWLWLHNRWPRE